MTYEIEIIEPSVQTLIDSLANLNLIKLIRRPTVEEAEEFTREEVLEGWRGNVEELRGAILEGKPLRSAWSLLAEIQKEAK
jgi:hypothetical protein